MAPTATPQRGGLDGSNFWASPRATRPSTVVRSTTARNPESSRSPSPSCPNVAAHRMGLSRPKLPDPRRERPRQRPRTPSPISPGLARSDLTSFVAPELLRYQVSSGCMVASLLHASSDNSTNDEGQSRVSPKRRSSATFDSLGLAATMVGPLDFDASPHTSRGNRGLEALTRSELDEAWLSIASEDKRSRAHPRTLRRMPSRPEGAAIPGSGAAGLPSPRVRHAWEFGGGGAVDSGVRSCSSEPVDSAQDTAMGGYRRLRGCSPFSQLKLSEGSLADGLRQERGDRPSGRRSVSVSPPASSILPGGSDAFPPLSCDGVPQLRIEASRELRRSASEATLRLPVRRVASHEHFFIGDCDGHLELRSWEVAARRSQNSNAFTRSGSGDLAMEAAAKARTQNEARPQFANTQDVATKVGVCMQQQNTRLALLRQELEQLHFQRGVLRQEMRQHLCTIASEYHGSSPMHHKQGGSMATSRTRSMTSLATRSSTSLEWSNEFG